MQDRIIESKGGPEDEVRMQKAIAEESMIGIVELGVLYGETSRKFCKANPAIPVYGIDPLIPDSMNPNLRGTYDLIKENTCDCPNFNFIHDFSYNAIKNWDKPFDYIFIDASHYYQDVKRDFEDWFPLLVKSGYVSLHDSAANRGGPYHWPGPSQLADELIQDGRVKFIGTIYSLTIFQKI